MIADLKNTSIYFSSNEKAPSVSISFAVRGEALDIRYAVNNGGNSAQQGILTIEVTEKENAGKLLAYHLFGIHKTKIGEQPRIAPAVEKEKIEKPEKSV